MIKFSCMNLNNENPNFWRINKRMRTFINLRNKIRLKNKEISLIASNCNGCMILHDLGLRFNSPFVNLFIEPKDFLKYLKNIKHYNESSLVFLDAATSKEKFPVALLDDITIYFMHYKNNEDAKGKWMERMERMKRMNDNNIFVMMTETQSCTYHDLIEFDELPYKYKVVFTHKKYHEINSSYYIKGFEEQGYLGILSDYKTNQILGKRYYDDFDYVKWFNNPSY
jgi:uncharacterized protein (DUF1919 family)